MDLPLAISQLEGMIGSLEAYLVFKDPTALEVASGELPAEESPAPPETTPGPQGGQQPPE